MISAASTGDEAAFSTAPAQIEAAAAGGHPGTQSALAFLTGAGMTCPVSRSRAFLLHKFAADVGDLQSKMALAYSYFRQEKRWWKSECWTDCYTVILCTTVWIFWKGLGHGLLYEITEGHASIKNQKIPEMRWHFICELNLICSFYSQTMI